MSFNFTTGLRIKAWIRLIRLPNLVIIVLTQVLLRYWVIQKMLGWESLNVLTDFLNFLLLVIATILISVAGYVINDYYDVRIDEINKPGKQVVENLLSHKDTIKIHLVLNGIAILIGFFLAYKIKNTGFAMIFPLIAGLLWFYSAKYKRVFFWGNFIVALLSASVILVVWLFFISSLQLNPSLYSLVFPSLLLISRIFLAYALFAFLVSLFREIIKDMEDMEGDAQFGCHTIPIVLGLLFTRLIILLIILITMILLGYLQFVGYFLGFTWLFWYLLIFVQIPLLFLAVRLFFTEGKSGFHQLSSISKFVMLTGILSMFPLLKF